MTPQPKPISVWSSSSSSEISIPPIHQSGTKTYILHTLALHLSLSQPSSVDGGRDSWLSDKWLVCLPVCLHGPHLNRNPQWDHIAHIHTHTHKCLCGLCLCGKHGPITLWHIPTSCSVYWYTMSEKTCTQECGNDRKNPAKSKRKEIMWCYLVSDLACLAWKD